MRRSGFTLLELLVVVAIIGLMAALLFPVMHHPGENPERSACQQNMRQVGLAIKQYLSDHSEHFPVVNVAMNPYGWADALQPYVKNTQLFQCPKEPGQPSVSPGAPVPGSDPGYTDFFYNRVLQAKPEAKLQYIANTIMLGDALPANARSWSNGCRNLPCAAHEAGKRAFLPGAATRHLQGANYCFTDGHIKWLKGLDANTSSVVTSGNSNASSSDYSFAIE